MDFLIVFKNYCDLKWDSAYDTELWGTIKKE